MADTPTPLLDALVDSAKGHFIAVEIHNLKCDSLQDSFDHFTRHRPDGPIIDIADQAANRFAYIDAELSGLSGNTHRHAALTILRGLVISRLINDPDVIALVRNRGLAITDRGSIGNPH